MTTNLETLTYGLGVLGDAGLEAQVDWDLGFFWVRETEVLRFLRTNIGVTSDRVGNTHILYDWAVQDELNHKELLICGVPIFREAEIEWQKIAMKIDEVHRHADL